MIDADRLAEVLIEITDTLVEDVSSTAFLQLVTTQTALMSQALWAGVVLGDREGRLQLAAASTESTVLSEIFELEDAAGPWLDCFRSGSPVVNTDLTEAEERWPVLVPLAIDAGFRSVSAFPLRRRKSVVGALALFSSDPEHLEPRDVRIMQALVDVTTIGLFHERSPQDDAREAADFQSSLTNRIAGEQAKGALARTRGISVDAASEIIEDHARRTHQHPEQLADAVLAKHDLAHDDLADDNLVEAKEPNALLTPAEVAAMFRVDPKTITRWAKIGQLTAVRTLGGHRRYRYGEVTRLLKEG